jgi:hypothetical protein
MNTHNEVLLVCWAPYYIFLHSAQMQLHRWMKLEWLYGYIRILPTWMKKIQFWQNLISEMKLDFEQKGREIGYVDESA